MTETPQSIQQQIAELEADLQQATRPALKRAIERELADLRAQQSPSPATLFLTSVKRAAPLLAGTAGAFTVGVLATSGLAPLLTAGLTTSAIAQWLAGMGANALADWIADWAVQQGDTLLHKGADERQIAAALQAQIEQHPGLLEDAARLLEETQAIAAALDALAQETTWQSDTLLVQLQFIEQLLEGQRRSDLIQGKLYQQVIATLLAQKETLVQGQQQLSDEHRRILAAIERLEQQVRVEGYVGVDDHSTVDVAVGVNLGTIIYDRSPEEDERRQLVNYLQQLAAKLSTLPLRGLADKLDQRGEGVAMCSVYTMLATTRRVEVAQIPDPKDFFNAESQRHRDAELEGLRDYFDNEGNLKPDYHPDHALPTDALFVRQQHENEPRTTGESLLLERALLATEAVQHHRRCFLLAAPGGGKSTFVRHLAWALAQRGLDHLNEQTTLHGWQETQRLLPVLLPLRILAGKLVGVHERDYDRTLSATLQAAMAAYDYDEQDAIGLLRESLQQEVALLLLDGLDEVPLEATDTTADRMTTVQAIRSFTRLYKKVLVVVTCRTRAFTDDIRICLGWQVEELAPFTLGQVRHFLPAWYHELAAKTELTREQAQKLSAELVGTLEDDDLRSQKLREMAGTPLLLTLMALVLYNEGTLPKDRPQLYEKVLDLLLGRWDKVREGQTIGEVIGRPGWTSEYIMPVLDRLSYEAHNAASSEDGRGRLHHTAIRVHLETYFQEQGQMKSDEAAAAAVRCLAYIDERSGLIAPDGNDTYAFVHLTLQEHCAGRCIALQSVNPIELVMQHRTDDRWREPIFLGMGVADPRDINDVLRTLIEQSEREPDQHCGKTFPSLSPNPSPIEGEGLLSSPVPPCGGRGQGKGGERQGSRPLLQRWYRDLILAAEIGVDRDWSYLRMQPRVEVERLQRGLRDGLVSLLEDKNQPLPTAERVRAGFLLGDLGDPRVPVTVEEWQRELARVQAGDSSGYFCKVQAGTYLIGSSDDDPDADEDEKPQHRVTFEQPFWIARFSITNAQWQAWVQQGGEDTYLADDTERNRPNQPVVAVSWHMCNAFCAWLSEQIGMHVRLPTEAEWEAAARGPAGRRYPWGDTWQEDCAATAEDEDTRGWRWSVPVGCYPQGIAPCGARDMAGNVWEWTADVWRSHPGAKEPFEDKNSRVPKGGYYGGSRTRVRCAARYRLLPVIGFFYLGGFRLVLSP